MSSASPAPEPSDSGGTPELPPGASKTRPIACVRCWKRKQKCDRRLPACTACETQGVECIPRNQDINSLSELSNASVVNYVESLKRRVAELEHNVQSSSRKRARTESYRAASTDGPSPADVGNVCSQDAVSGPPSHASVRNVARDNEDSSVRATMGAIGFLSRSAMAEPPDQSDDLPRKFSLGEIVSGALAIDGRDPSKASPAPHTPTVNGHSLALTRDTTSGYFRRFLEYAIFLPYLDQAGLMEQYDSVISSNAQSHNGARNPLHVFNVHMALAIGIMTVPDSAHLSMLSAGFHAVATEQLQIILRSEASLEHIHCMIMLLLYSLSNSVGGSAWHLLGLTVKTCISLGLHREPDSHADLTTAELNRRRWLFWSVYSLDRTLSIAMDRPLSIQDDDISVRIPAEEVDSPVSCQETSARLSLSRYLVNYMQVVSSIRTGRRADILLDYSNICHWKDLPPCMERSMFTTLNIADVLQQLHCRALTQLVSPIHRADADTDLLLGTVHDVEMDTISTCERFIDRCYGQLTQGGYSGNFVDAYDIFQAAVICACLTWRLNQQASGERQPMKVNGTIHKASTLVTAIASRFPALAAFQRVLLTLSMCIVGEKLSGYDVGTY
ncbi:hypothetical protein LZ31DRAFT_504896 [Colletotrichum somersetense]|nr:hypothetical protein LZ31DRAFT_504896 [Colletotrichum somersetense]